MKNIKKTSLIYLHGSGCNKNSYIDTVNMVANFYNANLITFNAPIKKIDSSDNGFMWFRKFVQNNRRDAIKSDYEKSIIFIEEKINNLQLNTENTIVLGHSQGGTMAIAIGLKLKFKKIITICCDMPYNLEYINKTNSLIDWYECKNDGYITKERQNSYKLLEKINANIQYKLLENSSHFDFKQDIENLIKNKEL